MTNHLNQPYTVPGLEVEKGHRVADVLQRRIHVFNELQLTLKHAHWNVMGRSFIGIHEMLDPQINIVRVFIDDLAERVATLGVAPNGLPGALVASRVGEDYHLGRANSLDHIAALDEVYNSVISGQREAIEQVSDLDPVTEDMLIGQTGELEKFQWFLRSHLEFNN